MLRRLRATAGAATAVAVMIGGVLPFSDAAAATPAILGSGSAAAAHAVDQWVADVDGDGTKVFYAASGSAQGRADFASGAVDFAVSDLPLSADDSGGRAHAYVPLVATGVAFPYHLEVDGVAVRGLRFSAGTIAGILTRRITRWADPAIAADNHGRALPATPIIPVVRSDAARTTEVLTGFLASKAHDTWVGCSGGPATTTFPLHCGASSGADLGRDGSRAVMDTVQSTNGAIGYTETPYPVVANAPFAALQNDAGVFVQPNRYAVALALEEATVYDDGTADLDGVYAAPDKRAYPLSYYEYAIVPTSSTDPRMSAAKRQVLTDFLAHDVCAGQRIVDSFGYGPLPRNVTEVALARLATIGAADTSRLALAACDNPTFDRAHLQTDVLGTTAPQPKACQYPTATPCGSAGPPRNTVRPAIAGLVRVGATVRARKGTWVGERDIGSVRWLVGDVVVGSGSALRVPRSLLGKRLRVEVAYAADGYPLVSATSVAQKVQRGRFGVGRVSIAGRPVVGRRLVVRHAAVAGARTTVQWYAGGRAIRGAHGLCLRVRRVFVGKRIAVRVRTAAPAYETLVRTSARTRPVRRP